MAVVLGGLFALLLALRSGTRSTGHETEPPPAANAKKSAAESPPTRPSLASDRSRDTTAAAAEKPSAPSRTALPPPPPPSDDSVVLAADLATDEAPLPGPVAVPEEPEPAAPHATDTPGPFVIDIAEDATEEEVADLLERHGLTEIRRNGTLVLVAPKDDAEEAASSARDLESEPIVNPGD